MKLLGLIDIISAWFAKKAAPKEAPPIETVMPIKPPKPEGPLWLQIARKEMGTKETPGANSTARIKEYLHSTNLPDADASKDETPWCSAFANWCMKEAGITGTNSAWARGWLKWGCKLTAPRPGCVVVFSRGVVSGHVAFYLGPTKGNDNTVDVIGGNQHDSVCVAAFEKSRILGYRWPDGVA